MKYEITIQGVTPLLMNRFTEAAQQSLSAPKTVLQGKKGTPREQAEPKAYRNEKGNYTVPGVNIFRAIVDAGSFIKSGKTKLTTQKSSLVTSFAFMETLEAVVCNEEKKPVPDFEVDSRGVVIPATGGRIMAHRPRFDVWNLTFQVELDETECSPELFRELVDQAGKKVGLGDFRPSRKGVFGRFKVTHWQKRAA